MNAIVLIPVFLLCAGLPVLGIWRLLEKEQKKKYLKGAILFAAVSAVLLLLLFFAVDRLTEYTKPPSLLSMAVLGSITGLGFLWKNAVPGEQRRCFLKRTAIIAVVLFAGEFLVMNAKSFRTAEPQPSVSGEVTEVSEAVQVSTDSIRFSDDGSVILHVQSPDVHALSLQFTGEDTNITCKVEIMDGNFSKRFVEVGRKNLSADGSTAEFSFHTYETLENVKITLTDLNDPVSITGYQLQSALPLRFSNLRFLFLCGIMALICAIVTFRWYLCCYDPKSRVHTILVAAVVVVCTLMPLFLLHPSQEMIDPDKVSIRYSDPFVQMFDAFQDGRTWIDIPVDPDFAALEDPYDYSVRAEADIPTAWDRAYYNGKYYAYYGAAPVLTLYFPVYWLTGKLPTVNQTCICFGMLAAFCLCGAIHSFVRRFLSKVNLVSLLCMMLAASCCTGIHYLMADSSFYSIPGLAGTAFLMLCIWSGISAERSQKAAVRYPLFLLSGAALALCAASRPTRAISALLLVPLFLAILLRKENSLKSKLSDASAFLLPVLAGGIGIMAYNHARFGAPLEFGAVYQITVSDVNANTLHLSSLPFALLQYFFQPYAMSPMFPYLTLTTTSLSGYGQYIYTANSHGALLYPLLLTGTAALPFLLYATRRKQGQKLSLDDTSIRRCTYLLMLVIAVVVAWFDFCIAGVIYSYVADILPILTLLAVWVLLDVQERLSEIRSTIGISVSVITAAAGMTLLLGFLEILSLYGKGLYTSMPQLAHAMEELFCFWN